MGEYMRQTLALVCVIAVVTLTIGCSGCSDTKDGTAGDAGRADFDQRMSVADSLYNSMQFRDAYDLYLQLLNHPVAEADSEKKLYVLSSISNASELSGHMAEETKWLQQQRATTTTTPWRWYRWARTFSSRATAQRASSTSTRLLTSLPRPTAAIPTT